ncbi:uncharacterized protein LOC128388861 [Panonychus citri]|uniref:uncharacterized protein LOC128388861 n=1 Tax=Panonychus citri TaxID=50023 RepID=UPI002306F16D|nr:uncharacterized protein LOC128388861 [Panonychus citri]
MKSLIVFTLVIASAFGSSQVNQLLDQLDDLLIAAHSSKNIKALESIEDAIDSLTFSAARLQTASADEAKIYQQAIDDVEKDFPALEKLVKSTIKSRGWITSSLSFVASSVTGAFTKVTSIFDTLNKSGFGGLIAIFQPYIDQLQQNGQVKNIISGLKVVEQGLYSLNKMTGGAIAPLNTVTDVLANIDTAGDLFQTMSTANSSEAISDALINTLVSAKGSNLEKIEKGLDYVCNGMTDAAKSS